MFSINEALQMKSLTFVIDACKILAQARKVGILNGVNIFFYFFFPSISSCFLYANSYICVICHVGAGILVCLQLLQPGH